MSVRKTARPRKMRLIGVSRVADELPLDRKIRSVAYQARSMHLSPARRVRRTFSRGTGLFGSRSLTICQCPECGFRSVDKSLRSTERDSHFRHLETRRKWRGNPLAAPQQFVEYIERTACRAHRNGVTCESTNESRCAANVFWPRARETSTLDP